MKSLHDLFEVIIFQFGFHMRQTGAIVGQNNDKCELCITKIHLNGRRIQIVHVIVAVRWSVNIPRIDAHVLDFDRFVVANEKWTAMRTFFLEWKQPIIIQMNGICQNHASLFI